jgi:hypothetical protein
LIRSGDYTLVHYGGQGNAVRIGVSRIRIGIRRIRIGVSHIR